MEEWRPIEGISSCYVSSLGNVRRRVNPTNTKRRQWLNYKIEMVRGYCRIQINHQHYSVHRLVYQAFNGPLMDGFVIAHLDGCPSNNTPANLAQVTLRENSHHRYGHGTMCQGESNVNAIHTNLAVSNFKQALKLAPRSPTGRVARGFLQATAERLNISYSSAASISRGASWKRA
jgi:hypothetical protein